MRQLEYSHYLDKVLGCWLGKCIAGTLGAPYEGVKELLNLEFNSEVLNNILPNDDLDIQLIWLEVLEQKGINFTSNDLAEAFSEKCPYSPGEYAYFKKNYRRGIYPPLSGVYNNRYYHEGMGCPIRSEIWACICPGNPEKAAGLSEKDGILDHSANSVYAEKFITGIESAAFFESDITNLFHIGLGLIPADSRMAALLRDTMKWCAEYKNWEYVRQKIIQKYGHPDCTNVFQNMGFILLALLFGETDFIKTVTIALNCGFDTDCTCATAGALLGIIKGAEAMKNDYGFTDTRFVAEVNVKRVSGKVSDLAADTCCMGVYFSKYLDLGIKIAGYPEYCENNEWIKQQKEPILSISVNYPDNRPVIGLGDITTICITFTNHTGSHFKGAAYLYYPEEWETSAACCTLEILPYGNTIREIDISVPFKTGILQETNILKVEVIDAENRKFQHSFGMIGAVVWRLFGPFWENYPEPIETYTGQESINSTEKAREENGLDILRNCHLNTRTDLHKEYMTIEQIEQWRTFEGSDAYREGLTVNTYEDRIDLNNIIGFQGPCTIYMIRYLFCPEERCVNIMIGHTDAYSCWLNGNLIDSRNNTDWCTAENVHKFDCMLNRGINKLILKLVRRSNDAQFSLTFSKGKTCTDHYGDLGSMNPTLL